MDKTCWGQVEIWVVGGRVKKMKEQKRSSKIIDTFIICKLCIENE